MKGRALIISITFLVLWLVADRLLGAGINWGWFVIGVLIAVITFAAVASIRDFNPF